MRYMYGFELEGFFFKEGNLSVPENGLPVDGFPGLVELRTQGGDKLSKAYWNIFEEYIKHPGLTCRCFNTPFATFTPEQKRQIRKHRGYHKPEADIQNIYGKKPKALGNKTIASLQVNISNLVSERRNTVDKGEIRTDYEKYGLLDVGRIVKALDKEFEKDIRESGRQPGEYCIKQDRLEYRSLPNRSFEFSLDGSKRFLDRIRIAVEGK